MSASTSYRPKRVPAEKVMGESRSRSLSLYLVYDLARPNRLIEHSEEPSEAGIFCRGDGKGDAVPSRILGDNSERDRRIFVMYDNGYGCDDAFRCPSTARSAALVCGSFQNRPKHRPQPATAGFS